MPSITSGKVLVSGASGFVASWVCKTLLTQGFSVRGTVRSTAKGENVRKLFIEYGDRFEYAVVEDMSKDGAFDEAVRGVDAVEHTASPVHLAADDPDELIQPAVQGTLGMLKSVKKNGSAVKRVVITSSCAAVFDPANTSPGARNELSWNESCLVNVKGRDATNLDKYRASKVMAERAAWEFVEKEAPEIGFDVVTIMPSFVFGPIIHEVSSPSSLNESIRIAYDIVSGASDKVNPEWATTSVRGFVDVRDVAEMHVKSLTVPFAGRKRFIASSGPFFMLDIGEIAKGGKATEDPDGTKHLVFYDNTLAKELLGITFIPFEKCIQDTIDALRDRGWVKDASS